MIVSVGTVIPTRNLRIVDLSLSGNRPDPFFLEEPHYQMGIEALLIPLANRRRSHCGVRLMMLTIFRASYWPTVSGRAELMASAIRVRFGLEGRKWLSST